jgi:hypothetical protein
MRLAFLSDAVEWNGAARVFAMAARAFLQAGDEVRFVVRPDTALQERLAAENLPLELLPAGGWLFSALRLRRILQANRIDVVLVHSEREHFMAALASRFGGGSAIVRRTGPGQRLARGLFTRIGARLARTAFMFTGQSDAHAARVPARLGPVVVAELGIPVDGVRPETDSTGARARDPFHIVCLYDGIARGLTALPIRTVALLANRHPEVHLSMVGTRSDAEDIRMHVASLNVLDRVALLGERDDLPLVMREATFGWVACRGDDAALAMLDLMAAGLPVVAPDDGIARRYIADGITGVVVRSEDATLAAGALAGVLGRADQVQAMAEAARARVAREFPQSRMLEGFDRAAKAARDRSAATDRSTARG